MTTTEEYLRLAMGDAYVPPDTVVLDETTQPIEAVQLPLPTWRPRPGTKLAMVLEMLERGPACGHEFLRGAGGKRHARYSVSIHVLRNHGYNISGEPCIRHPGDSNVYEFKLTA